MPRSLIARTGDARRALSDGVDVWVATASSTGSPHLVPLSFASDGEVIVAATPASSVTARNLDATGRARLGFGELRDVVMVDAQATVVPWADGPPARTSLFVERCGWNPSSEPYEFVLVSLRPTRIQVWRTLDELQGRNVMKHGRWLTEGAPLR